MKLSGQIGVDIGIILLNLCQVAAPCTVLVVVFCVERAKALSSGGVVYRCILRRLLAADQSVPVRCSLASSTLSVRL